MIRGYSLFKNHRVFVSHTFPKDDARVSLAYFLDALVLGKASLFMGKDSSKMVHFFLSKDTTFVELKNQKKIIEGIEGREITHDKSFLKTCNWLLGDCGPDEFNFAFSELALINRVRHYNECANEKHIEKEHMKKQAPNDLYSKFAKAKLVTAWGDTIRGFVRYLSERELNVIVRFRRNINDEDELFKPDDLSFFQLDNARRQFEPIADLEYYPNSNTDDEEIIESAFVKMIVKGKVSLFSLKDNNNHEHLFLSKEGKAYELRIKTSRVDGRKFHALLYNGILNLVLGDCGRTASYNIPFTKPYLIRAVVEYNDCRHDKSLLFDNRRYSQKLKNLQF